MKNEKPEINAVIEQLRHLQEAVVDASSVIYMQKAGFLEPAAQILRFHSPLSVAKETGYRDLPIEIHECNTNIDSPDAQILYLARTFSFPVVSEDKKVLLTASKHGLPYYNALMILNYLLDKNHLDLNGFLYFRKKLFLIARYGRNIQSYGALVTENILKSEFKGSERINCPKSSGWKV